MGDEAKTKASGERLAIPVRFINPEKQYDYVQTYTVKKKMKHCSLYNCPLLNTIYDEFLDEATISNQRIENLVMISTLLSGLFLGAVMGIPMSVDFGEVEEARERFSKAPYNATRWKSPTIIQELSMYTTAAVYMLGASMCGIVVFYLLGGMETSNSDNTPRKIRESWWFWNRSIIFFIFISTLLGMVASFLAFNRFAFIKFPDMWVENGGESINGTWSKAGRPVAFPSGRSSTYGSYLSWGYFYLILSIICMMMVMSFTRCVRNLKEPEVYRDYIERTKVWIDGREKIYMFLNMIVLIWDMEDNLKDSSNPFLLNLDSGDLRNMESTREREEREEKYGSRIQKPSQIKSSVKVSHELETSVAFHHDPRVNKAFGVIQLADYCQWETFIRDYNDKQFNDFSSRWRVSFGKIAPLYPKLQGKVKDDEIYKRCKQFVDKPMEFKTICESKPLEDKFKTIFPECKN